MLYMIIFLYQSDLFITDLKIWINVYHPVIHLNYDISPTELGDPAKATVYYNGCC